MTDTTDVLRFRRAREVFDGAAERSTADRREFLDAECGDDAALRSEVEAMLASLDEPDFLDVTDAPSLEEVLPETIAHYEVVARLGRGGFGAVYHARQTAPVEREVALKVLYERPHEDRPAHRFEAECQSLARIEHPNVARLYEAGHTGDGRRYLAMELVRGRPITSYCDHARLDVRARVELFRGVCEAVQHVHQRAVVHRDLKPGNVLVADVEGRAVPKVIDFGIAKHEVDGSVTRTMGPIGTPAYMSPEQAAGTPVDTRTDVYALGVLLFELLAGDLPFDRDTLSSSSPLDVLRMLQGSEPRRMTTALSESALGALEVARRRATEPAALGRILGGDLQWVVRRAMAKSADERYASVSDLVADLDRFLADLPVAAREPAALYIVRKFVRRHRLAVAAGVIAIALVAVSITVLATLLDAVSKESARAVESEYAAHLAAARAALQMSDVSEAKRHLRQAAEEHRGWEWRYLAAQCDRSARSFDLDGVLFQCAWIDDRHVVVRRVPRQVLVVDVESGEVVRSFEVTGNILSLRAHVESRRLVVSTYDGLFLWDTAGWGEPVQLLETVRLDDGRRNSVRDFELTSDGRHAITCENGGAVRRVDLTGASAPRVLCRVDEPAYAVELVPGDEAFLLGYSEVGRVERRDAVTGELVSSFQVEAREGVSALETSSDGNVAYVACGTVLHAWSASESRTIGTRETGVVVRTLELSPDGATLYGSGGWRSGRVTSWDADSLAVREPFHGHRLGVVGLAVSPDGSRLVTASQDRTMRVWDATPPAHFALLPAGWSAQQLSASPDGRSFATAGRRGSVTVWDAGTLEVTESLQTGEDLTAVALGRTKLFVAGGAVWQVEDGELREVAQVERHVDGLEMDPSERWLLATSRGSADLWSLEDMRRVGSYELRCVPRASFDEATGEFLIGDRDGGVVRLDPRSGTLARGSASDVVPDTITSHGGSLAIGSRAIEVVDPRGTTRSRFGAGLDVSSLAFFSGGERLAAGNLDTVLRVWTSDGLQLLNLDEAPRSLFDVAVMDDGRRLIALSHTSGDWSYVAIWTAPDEVTLSE